jgi:hypothetical protein
MCVNVRACVSECMCACVVCASVIVRSRRACVHPPKKKTVAMQLICFVMLMAATSIVVWVFSRMAAAAFRALYDPPSLVSSPTFYPLPHLPRASVCGVAQALQLLPRPCFHTARPPSAPHTLPSPTGEAGCVLRGEAGCLPDWA